MAQRSAEGTVDLLRAGVRYYDLGGGQASQQSPPRVLARWRAPSPEEILELAPITPSMIWRLPDAQQGDPLSTTTPGGGSRALRGGRDEQHPVDLLHPHSRSHLIPPVKPLSAREVGSVALGGGYERARPLWFSPAKSPGPETEKALMTPSGSTTTSATLKP